MTYKLFTMIKEILLLYFYNKVYNIFTSEKCWWMTTSLYFNKDTAGILVWA